MRTADLIRIAIAALGRQKARAFLTVLSVVVGSATLVISVAVGRGVETAIIERFRKVDQLRQIHVYQNVEAGSGAPSAALEPKGAMSEARRERLRETLAHHWSRSHASRIIRLTPEHLARLRALPHVSSVTPFVRLDGRATVPGLIGARDAMMVGSASDDQAVRSRVIVENRRPDDSGRGVLVREYLLYTWGVTRDQDIQAILGQRLRLEVAAGPQRGGKVRAFLQAFAQTTPAPDHLVEEFPIVGVLREWSPADEEKSGYNWQLRDADVVLPSRVAEGVALRVHATRGEGFTNGVVQVDREENVEAVEAAVHDMGLGASSLSGMIRVVRTNIRLITFGVSLAAVAALLVAALGIANTMVMGVLERTREIGVMKAVGARDRDVRRLFLTEGALIGLCGGLVGVAVGWLAQFPGDAIARPFMEQRAGQSPDPNSTIFLYPTWLLLGVPLLSTMFATLSAVLPARRGAQLNPVDAIRYE